MKILSHTMINKKHYVLTIGNIAALSGNFKNDVAVYVGATSDSAEQISRTGDKLPYLQACDAGYAIESENYRS
jgi:hypothetical protein